MTELARLLDRDEIDSAEGPRGTMSIALPVEWLAGGDTVEVVVPTRLVCARCEGGGCDACGRSGAIRIAGEQAERTTRFVLPKTTSERLVVRLVRPLGDEVDLSQLCIEVRIATASTPTTDGCTRIAPPRAEPPASSLPTVLVATAVALALAAVIAAGLR